MPRPLTKCRIQPPAATLALATALVLSLASATLADADRSDVIALATPVPAPAEASVTAPLPFGFSLGPQLPARPRSPRHRHAKVNASNSHCLSKRGVPPAGGSLPSAAASCITIANATLSRLSPLGTPVIPTLPFPLVAAPP